MGRNRKDERLINRFRAQLDSRGMLSSVVTLWHERLTDCDCDDCDFVRSLDD